MRDSPRNNCPQCPVCPEMEPASPPPRPIVAARWVRSEPHFTPIGRWGSSPADTTHIYELVARPSAPLSHNTYVRVLALSKPIYYLPHLPLEYLEVYDPHVYGPIVSVREATVGRGAKYGVFRIVNTCRRNPVKHVELWAPMLPQLLFDAGDWRVASGGLDYSKLVSRSAVSIRTIGRPCDGSVCGLARRGLGGGSGGARTGSASRGRKRQNKGRKRTEGDGGTLVPAEDGTASDASRLLGTRRRPKDVYGKQIFL